MRRLLLSLCSLALIGAGLQPTAQAGPTEWGIASDGIEFVNFVPFDQSTSTGATIHKDRLYLTSWKNISVYDIKDPANPQLMGQVPVGFMFENEDVAVSPNDTFLLFSESTPQSILHVWDVENPSQMQEIASVPGAGDHTTSCILGCKWSYGSSGHITDLHDPANPVLKKQNWRDLIKLHDSVHDVREVKPGFIIVAPINETPLYVDVRNPLKPKVIARGNGPTTDRGFLWHSGRWPNQAKDKWLIMQGEQNFQPRCDNNNGPISTFNTTGWHKTHTFHIADTFRVQNGVYADGSPAVNALGCSAHWFQENETFDDGGLIASAFYEHGTRFLDIDHKTGKIKEVGYFLPYVGSSSAAYWVTKRLTYTVDYGNGLYILRYTKKLP
ncbi:MAG: hypothetical protein QOH90_1752 [Actinomycetota bacterium]|nr:hypothetical protein [Actinomycetota bacterium]